MCVSPSSCHVHLHMLALYHFYFPCQWSISLFGRLSTTYGSPSGLEDAMRMWLTHPCELNDTTITLLCYLISHVLSNLSQYWPHCTPSSASLQSICKFYVNFLCSGEILLKQSSSKSLNTCSSFSIYTVWSQAVETSVWRFCF